MIRHHAIVAIYRSHSTAESAVKDLQHSGFNLKKLSVIGLDPSAGEHAMGYYNAGDRIRYWGTAGTFWGAIWGLLFGSAFLLIPGLGPLVIAGPLVAWTVAALDGTVTVDGLSALGTGLYSLGIPTRSATRYEALLKTGRFVVMAHGSAEDVLRAREILDRTRPESMDMHQPRLAIPEPCPVPA